MYEAVIFDHDGVLVEMTSMEIHRKGARDAFKRVGIDDPEPDRVEAMAHGVTVSTLQAVCDQYDLDPETFWRERDRAMARQQQAAIRRGEKGPYSDVDVLGTLDRPMAVVSSNQRQTVEYSLQTHGLSEYFESIHARKPVIESLRRKKPDPYYLHQALADLEAGSAVYVGDSQTDIEAAHAASIDAAFIRRPHRADTELSVEAEYELDSLTDILALVGTGKLAGD